MVKKVTGIDRMKVKDVLKYGNLHQLAGVLPLRLTDGPEEGVRGALIRSGCGLNLLVLADRGMDIGLAEFEGKNLNWNSNTGFLHPSYFEPEGKGWLRGFYGGFLTTGGLTYMGAPSIDKGEVLGLHGRASYIPARRFCDASGWEGDDYIIRVSGEIRETAMFGPDVCLKREIKVKFGERAFTLIDTVVNEGYEITPFMILYHFNLGYPLLSPASKFVSSSTLYVPRDEEAWEGHEEFDKVEPPTNGYKEKVYFHDLAADDQGFCYAGLVNGDWGVSFKFQKHQLRRLIQWKMLGQGTYVLGIEPANSLVMGRAEERRWGTLEELKPGEERKIEIIVEILKGKDEVQEFQAKIKDITDGQPPKVAKDVDEFVELTKRARW